jgi:hypothetical protein
VIVDELGVAVVADDSQLPSTTRAAFANAEPAFRSGGLAAGRAAARGFDQGFTTDVNGRLRDSRGRFAAAGRDSGRGFGDAAGREAGDRIGSETRRSTGRLSGVFGGVGRIAGGAFAAAAGAAVAVGFFASAISSASDLAESTSKVGVVFGDASAQVLRFADNSATAFGQSKAQALEATGTFGNLLRSIGLSERQSAKFSTTMVGLASDLASFNNTSTDEALEALRSGLVGETEPLKRFGVNLSAARIEEEALRKGLAKSKDELTDTAKAQAAYSLILKDTKLAQGDFARTSGGLANQQRILGAQWQNLKATLGAAFLPAVTGVVASLNEDLFPALDRAGAAFAPFVSKVGDGAREMAAAAAPALGRVRDSIRDAFAQAGEGEGPLAPLLEGARQLGDSVLPKLAGVGSAIGSFVGGLLPVLGELGTQILAVVGPALGDIGDILGNQVIPAFQAFLPAVLPVAKFLLTVIGGAVVGALKGAVTAIKGALTVVAGILNVFAAIFTGDWSRLWQGIKQILSGTFKVIIGLIQVFLNLGFGKLFKLGWLGLTKLFSAGTRAIGRLWRSGLDALVGIGRAILGRILGVITGYLRAYMTAWRFGLSGLASVARSALGAVVSLFRGLLGRIAGTLAGAGRALYGVGRRIVEGLISGIRSVGGRVGDALTGLIPGPLKKFASALKIGSPSRVFRDFGLNIGEGLVLGIDQSRSPVTDAAGRLGRAALPPAPAMVRPDLADLARMATAQARATLVPATGQAPRSVAGRTVTYQVDARGMDRNELVASLRAKERLDDVLYGGVVA